MVLTTPVTRLLGIEHPLICGGMHYVGFAPLAAAGARARAGACSGAGEGGEAERGCCG